MSSTGWTAPVSLIATVRSGMEKWMSGWLARLDGRGRLLVDVLVVLDLLLDLELVLGLVEGVYDLLELLDAVRRLLLVPKGQRHLTARGLLPPHRNRRAPSRAAPARPAPRS